MHLDPDDENVRLLLARDIDGPVVMLNLLRFRDEADYRNHPDLAPPTPISGAAAYDRYIAATLPFLEASGGGIDFLGDGGAFFIGPADEPWDLAMLIRQHSIQSFFDFASNADYLPVLGHREAALVDSRLLPLVERPVER